MSADFFKKRILPVVVIAAVLFCAAGGALYGWSVLRVTEIEVSKSFYFLVNTSSHIEASTHNAQYLGGAGYLLEYEEGVYVALSAYLNEADAARAKESLLENNESVDTVTVVSGNLRIKGKNEEHAAKLRGAFHSLYGNIEVLEKEIARLENGATQQSSGRILKILEKNFSYLTKEYETTFPAYAQACWEAAAWLKNAREDVIYVKDLRYLQCELCVSYGDLIENYAL